MSLCVSLIPTLTLLSLSLHSLNTTLKMLYTCNRCNTLMWSNLKRKCNHLPTEQALKREAEGEKAHTLLYVNMLQHEERGLWMLEEGLWGCGGASGAWGKEVKGYNRGLEFAMRCNSPSRRCDSCLGSVAHPAVEHYSFMWEEQNKTGLSAQDKRLSGDGDHVCHVVCTSATHHTCMCTLLYRYAYIRLTRTEK